MGKILPARRNVQIGTKLYGREVIGQPFRSREFTSNQWHCVCKCRFCQRIAVVRIYSVLTDCPCLVLRKHGESRTPLYRLWVSIRSRCDDMQNPRYGGRGIRICPEWSVYESFRDWAMANGYAKGLEIDRIDNDGNYEPANCRFVTTRVNVNNRNVTWLVTAFGQTKPLTEWAEDSVCVVDANIIRSRLRYGWSPEDAMTRPVRPLTKKAKSEKVVVIGIKPGQQVQVGETTVRVKRWRDGKALMEFIGPDDVYRSLDSITPEA